MAQKTKQPGQGPETGTDKGGGTKQKVPIPETQSTLDKVEEALQAAKFAYTKEELDSLRKAYCSCPCCVWDAVHRARAKGTVPDYALYRQVHAEHCTGSIETRCNTAGCGNASGKGRDFAAYPYSHIYNDPDRQAIAKAHTRKRGL